MSFSLKTEEVNRPTIPLKMEAAFTQKVYLRTMLVKQSNLPFLHQHNTFMILGKKLRPLHGSMQNGHTTALSLEVVSFIFLIR